MTAFSNEMTEAIDIIDRLVTWNKGNPVTADAIEYRHPYSNGKKQSRPPNLDRLKTIDAIYRSTMSRIEYTACQEFGCSICGSVT